MINAQTSPCLIPFCRSKKENFSADEIKEEKVHLKGSSPATQCIIASRLGNFSAFLRHLSQAISFFESLFCRI